MQSRKDLVSGGTSRVQARPRRSRAQHRTRSGPESFHVMQDVIMWPIIWSQRNIICCHVNPAASKPRVLLQHFWTLEACHPNVNTSYMCKPSYTRGLACVALSCRKPFVIYVAEITNMGEFWIKSMPATSILELSGSSSKWMLTWCCNRHGNRLRLCFFTASGVSVDQPGSNEQSSTVLIRICPESNLL